MTQIVVLIKVYASQMRQYIPLLFLQNLPEFFTLGLIYGSVSMRDKLWRGEFDDAL